MYAMAIVQPGAPRALFMVPDIFQSKQKIQNKKKRFSIIFII